MIIGFYILELSGYKTLKHGMLYHPKSLGSGHIEHGGGEEEGSRGKEREAEEGPFLFLESFK